MNRALAALALVLAVGIVAACQAQPVGSSCLRSVAPTGASGGCAPVEAPRDSSSTGGPPSSSSLDPNVPAEIDATLLEYLPDTVGDAAVQEDIHEAALAVAGPNLSRVASAVDVGVALDPSNANLVTAHVVRLREGALNDAAFRDWRDTFDDGACAAGGGIKGRAETTIDGRTVYVTTCVTGLRTYHLWIEEDDLLISAASIGAGSFGELLMDGLRIP